MSDDVRARAKEVWQDVNQFSAPEPADAFLEATLDQVFGRVWSRPGLTRKERRWITLTSIASAGAVLPLEVHVRSALESGDIARHADEYGRLIAGLRDRRLDLDEARRWPRLNSDVDAILARREA